jgi:molybdopterin molybdotransferase
MPSPPPASEPSPNPQDVRMRGFTRRATVDQARRWLDGEAEPLAAEAVSLEEGFGRVLAQEVISQTAVPGFTRAMMDGFALRAADTDGASPYNPLPLRIVAEILPGAQPTVPIQSGQAARIMTGAPLPDGADAVLPVERTQLQGQEVWALASVPPQKNVGAQGEDVQPGDRVFAAGRRLRPQDLGVLSSIGVDRVLVHRQPRVRIVITGNELVPSGRRPTRSQIVDANGPMLSALVRRDGGRVAARPIIPDREDAILAAMQDQVDVVLVSGGSSVGIEDFAPRLLATHGQLAFHGLAMRPSSPTGMGRLGRRLVFLLPGNPVSCLCAYDFFAGRAIRLLGGRCPDWPYRRAQLPLRRKLVSQIGRVDYARVCVVEGQVEPVAISGASMLTSTTRADGFVILPEDSEGYPPGAEVPVYFYDG